MPKTKQSTTKSKVEPKTPEQLQQENDLLRNELEEIKKLLANLNKSTSTTKKKEVVEPVAEVEIRPNKYIKVMSLTNGLLYLTTEPFGGGKWFEFKRFGEVKNIVYAELAEILHCHQSFVESGKFLILDKNVIFNHGLSEIYENLLTKDMIDNILEFNRDEMVELFKNATQSQQETIVSILIDKINKDEDVDLNRVDAISRVFGKNIIEMAEEAKSLMAG